MKKKQLNPKSKNSNSKSAGNGRALFSKTHGKHKKLLIIIASIVLLIGISIGSFFVFSQFFAKKKSSTNTTSLSKEAVKQLPSKASKIVAKEGYSAGQQYLDDALKTTSDNSNKAAIYQSKATLARNNASKSSSDSAKEAVQYAKEADNIKPSASTAMSVAIYAEYSGDRTLAIKYYELYLSRIQKDSPDYKYTKNYVEYLKSKG